MKSKGFKKVLFVLIALGAALVFAACKSASDKAPSGGNYNADSGGSSPSSPQVVENATGRKRVYTVNCRIETGGFYAALDGIAAELDAAQGYMDSSEINNPETGKNANFTLMVKTENLDSFLEGLKKYGTIASQKTTSKDVTTQAGNPEGDLEAYYAELELVEGYAAAETNPTYKLQYTAKITELNKKINDLLAKINGYNPLDYSTVNIVLYEKGAAPSEPTYGNRLAKAFSGVLDVFEFILIAIVYTLPFGAIGTGIVFLVYGLKKRGKKRNPEKYAAKPLNLPQNPAFSNANIMNKN